MGFLCWLTEVFLDVVHGVFVLFAVRCQGFASEMQLGELCVLDHGRVVRSDCHVVYLVILWCENVVVIAQVHRNA